MQKDGKITAVHVVDQHSYRKQRQGGSKSTEAPRVRWKTWHGLNWLRDYLFSGFAKQDSSVPSEIPVPLTPFL
jgi:hypothetical protein